MSNGDVRILKTASENLQTNSPLHVSIALRQLNNWINGNSRKANFAHKTKALFNLCAQAKVDIDNLDRAKLIKDCELLIKEIDKVSKNFENYTNTDSDLLKIVKRAVYREILPETEVVIIPKSGSLDERARYLRVLGSALRIELQADCCSLHHDGKDHVELQADISGSESNVKYAAAVIACGVTEAFELASGVKIGCSIKEGSSKLELMSENIEEKQFRKFAFKAWSE